MNDAERLEYMGNLKKAADTLVFAQVALKRAEDAEAECRAALVQAEAFTTQCRIAVFSAEKTFDALFTDGYAPSNDAPQSVLSPPPPVPPPTGQPHASTDVNATLPERIRAVLKADIMPVKVKDIIARLGMHTEPEAKSVRAALARMVVQRNGGIETAGHGRYQIKK